MFKMYVKECQFMTKTGRPSWALHYSISNSEASLSHFRKHGYDFTLSTPFFPTTNSPQVLEGFCHLQPYSPHMVAGGWPLPVTVGGALRTGVCSPQPNTVLIPRSCSKMLTDRVEGKAIKKMFFHYKNLYPFLLSLDTEVCLNEMDWNKCYLAAWPARFWFIHLYILSSTLLNINEFGRKKRHKVNKSIVKSFTAQINTIK